LRLDLEAEVMLVHYLLSNVNPVASEHYVQKFPVCLLLNILLTLRQNEVCLYSTKN